MAHESMGRSAENDEPRRTKRDDMDPLTRAVSDALDEYLFRHFGTLSSSSHPEDFMLWLSEQGYEVRPIPPADDFDARKVADKVRERLEAVGEWTDDDGAQLRMRDGRVERVIPPGGGSDA